MAISSFLKPLESDPFWFTDGYFFPVHYNFQLYDISQLGRIRCVSVVYDQILGAVWLQYNNSFKRQR